MLVIIQLILEESNLRSVSVGNPEVQVAILVPIDLSQPTPIIRQIKSGDRRNVKELALAVIQEQTVTLSATE